MNYKIPLFIGLMLVTTTATLAVSSPVFAKDEEDKEVKTNRATIIETIKNVVLPGKDTTSNDIKKKTENSVITEDTQDQKPGPTKKEVPEQENNTQPVETEEVNVVEPKPIIPIWSGVSLRNAKSVIGNWNSVISLAYGIPERPKPIENALLGISGVLFLGVGILLLKGKAVIEGYRIKIYE